MSKHSLDNIDLFNLLTTHSCKHDVWYLQEKHQPPPLRVSLTQDQLVSWRRSFGWWCCPPLMPWTVSKFWSYFYICNSSGDSDNVWYNLERIFQFLITRQLQHWTDIKNIIYSLCSKKLVIRLCWLSEGENRETLLLASALSHRFTSLISFKIIKLSNQSHQSSCKDNITE